jgi:hypothetical protein
VRARGRRTWLRVGIGAAVVVAAAVGGTVAVAVVGASHQPQVAATNFLRDLAARDVGGMLANAVIVSGDTGGSAQVALLSAADIAKEIALPADALGRVRDIRVLRSTVAGDAASVELQYVEGGQAQVQGFELVKGSTGSGWAVQIHAAVLHISVPEAGQPLTVAGIRVPTRSATVTVAVYPAAMQVAIGATPVFRADTQVAQASGGSATVDLPAQLTTAATTSAEQAVVALLGACVGATSFAPANCPNSDNPYSCSNGDQCTGITWSAQAGWQSGLQVSASSGTVTVSGSLTASDTYTDTTPASSFLGPSSNQFTDGPMTWAYSYPVTWTAGKWTIGTVQVQQTY